MNKVSGNQLDFSPIRIEERRVVIGYGLTQADGDIYEWYEVYLPKTQIQHLTLDDVKSAIIADIDAQTDAKILNGYEFTPDGADSAIVVWLSKESQTNFSEAHRLEVVPIKFKLNETVDKQAIYHTFTTFAELDRFYKGGVQYINQCLNEGWARKDAIEWEPYEEFFQKAETQANEE